MIKKSSKWNPRGYKSRELKTRFGNLEVFIPRGPIFRGPKFLEEPQTRSHILEGRKSRKKTSRFLVLEEEIWPSSTKNRKY